MTETVTEALGEKLFALSDSIREHGLLDDPKAAARYEAVVSAFEALSRASQPVDTGVDGAMTHSEALDAIVGAAGVTTLSYQEAIEGYLRLREMGQ